MWIVIMQPTLIDLELNIFKKEGKNIITNTYKIQADDWIICGFYCLVFIEFMLKGKCLLDYKNLFSPNKY